VEREAPSPGSHSAFPSSSRRARLDSNTTKIQTPAPCLSSISHSSPALPVAASPAAARIHGDRRRRRAGVGAARRQERRGATRQRALQVGRAAAPAFPRPRAKPRRRPRRSRRYVGWLLRLPLVHQTGRACAVFMGFRAEMEQGLTKLDAHHAISSSIIQPE
jgi:hypothetical protein